jgi:hypothetical protein
LRPDLPCGNVQTGGATTKVVMANDRQQMSCLCSGVKVASALI